MIKVLLDKYKENTRFHLNINLFIRNSKAENLNLSY